MDENETRMLPLQSFPGSGSDSGGSFGNTASSLAYQYQHRTEGYDYEFVPTPDPKYECAICLLILREPRQTKCGHRFCRDCITKWLRESEARCPVDNEAIDERELFADNFAKREILNFKVKCPNFKQGCEVLAVLRQLQEHVDQCPLALVPCPNNCNDILLRRDIPNHVQFNCSRRYLQCQNCRQQFYAEVMERHLLECPMVRIPCSFCKEELAKAQMEEHQLRICPKVPVGCDFSLLGCGKQLERAKMREHHQSSVVDHQLLLCNGIVTILHSLGIQSVPTETAMASSSGQMPTEMSNSLTAMSSLISQCQNVNISEISRTPDGQSVRPHSLSTPRTQIDIQKIHRSVSETMLRPQNDSTEAQRLSHTSKPSDAEGLQGAQSLTFVPGSDIHSLKTQNAFQDESLARHDQLLIELRDKDEMMEKANRELKHKLKHMESAIQDFEGRACNGQYYWKIKNYSRLRRDAEQGNNTALHSPAFYSSCYGYKLCVRANLNGVDAAKGSHLSIFIHFMQGEWDDILDWPFQGRIILSVIDQNPMCEVRHHIVETLISKPNLAAFQKPTTPRNHKGFGYMEFVALSILDNADFIRNDTLIIKAQVIPNP